MKTIAPRGSAYAGRAVQLDLPVIEAGDAAIFTIPDGIEAALILLAGDIEVQGHHLHRREVFDGAASAVYLPPATSVEVSATVHTELALAATVGGDLRAVPGAVPIVVEPTSVVINDRGRPGWQREVHDVIADGVPAQRLLVGETFNAAGEWSSFPPHKHDGGDGEPALEEVYYYRFDQSCGFGFQGLYEEAGPDRPASERAVFLRHGAVVGIPNGYHPVCAAPGYRLYYLWALSPLPGTARALALHEDPAHRWLHDRPVVAE
jgi:5-deoxy-glucuronate isomerase